MCDVLIPDDDDPLVRMTFADILADAGFILREAGSAAEALAVLQEPAGVHVLVADKDLSAPLGEPDGVAVVAEALRRIPTLVVVYASGQSGALDGHALTMREYVLPKPFIPKVLSALVRQVIG